MNTKLFKQLIKEAVREAVREELKQVLAEHAASQLTESYKQKLTENLSFTSDSVGPKHFPKTPQQAAAEKARMEKLFKPQAVQQPTEDWSMGSTMVEPEFNPPAPSSGMDFSAFLADTAQNFNPMELRGGE
jgi:DNA primase